MVRICVEDLGSAAFTNKMNPTGLFIGLAFTQQTEQTKCQ